MGITPLNGSQSRTRHSLTFHHLALVTVAIRHISPASLHYTQLTTHFTPLPSSLHSLRLTSLARIRLIPTHPIPSLSALSYSHPPNNSDHYNQSVTSTMNNSSPATYNTSPLISSLTALTLGLCDEYHSHIRPLSRTPAVHALTRRAISAHHRLLLPSHLSHAAADVYTTPQPLTHFCQPLRVLSSLPSALHSVMSCAAVTLHLSRCHTSETTTPPHITPIAASTISAPHETTCSPTTAAAASHRCSTTTNFTHPLARSLPPSRPPTSSNPTRRPGSCPIHPPLLSLCRPTRPSPSVPSYPPSRSLPSLSPTSTLFCSTSCQRRCRRPLLRRRQ